MSLTSRLAHAARMAWRGARRDRLVVSRRVRRDRLVASRRVRRDRLVASRVVPLAALLVTLLAASLSAACGGAVEQSPGATTQGREVPVPSPAATPSSRAEGPAVAPATGGFGASIGFRSRQRLDEHYEKHGREFGRVTREEYLRQAQSLRDAPVGGAVLEIARGDGSLSRFDRASGAFLAFDPDGTIRTFFRPNDGEAYFRRQATRRRNP